MKILYLVIAMLYGAFGTSEAALTQLVINSTMASSRFGSNPLIVGAGAKLVLTYDSEQMEYPEFVSGDPEYDSINFASSFYTISNQSAVLTIGSYSWTANYYEIEIGNDVPVLTPLDYFRVRFTAPAPPEFALLGFNELTDTFHLELQDSSLPDGKMDFINSNALPKPGFAFEINSATQSYVSFRGDAIPNNWVSFFSRPTSIEITQIPEVGATSLVLLSLTTLVFRRKRFAK